MTTYLSNQFCNFKPLFKRGRKKKIVSSSLFRVKGGGYKDFEKYIDSLYIVNEYVKNKMKDFVHRLFIDKTVYQDKKSMMKLNKLDIEIVVYDCPKFKDGDVYHRGVFGMMVRFFPMFNFPNNDAKIVLISDADFDSIDHMSRIIGKIYNGLGSFENLTYGASGKYWNFSQNSSFEKHGPYIISNKQISNGDLDKNIIINFLKEEPEDNLSDYMGKNAISEKKYVYGYDEWFINHRLFPSIRSSKIPYSLKITNRIIDIISYTPRIYHVNSMKFLSKKHKLELMKFYKYVIPERNFSDIRHAFKYMLEKYDVISFDSPTKEQTNFIIRIYEYFIYIRDTKNVVYFDKKFISHVLSSRYIGIFDYGEEHFYNIDRENFFFCKKELDEGSKKYLKSLL